MKFTLKPSNYQHFKVTVIGVGEHRKINTLNTYRLHRLDLCISNSYFKHEFKMRIL